MVEEFVKNLKEKKQIKEFNIRILRSLFFLFNSCILQNKQSSAEKTLTRASLNFL